MRHENLDIDGKKREIVEWAFDRFYEGGFHATAIDAAMAGSGISKRTIYKYFSSKEELIEAVLVLYGAFIVQELFDPVSSIADPKQQIVAFFDTGHGQDRRILTRGCLGLKAAQEYAGKHERIVALGRHAASRAEAKFTELCGKAGLAQPEALGKQLNVIFQGALLLSHATGDTTAFASAKTVAAALLERAAAGGTKASG
jgi:AcrR family transcriptional regulator